jgi:phytoene dehydrogenase-like protein
MDLEAQGLSTLPLLFPRSQATPDQSTIFEMLEGKYTDKKIEDYYENYETVPSYVQVSLGISRTFENEPHHVVIPAGKPLIIDESATYQDILVRIISFDPTLAPEGKGLSQVKHRFSPL